MSRPRLLDLFCGAGGAGMGYYRAGFEVVGVDIYPQPRYPFPFVQDDALEFVLADDDGAAIRGGFSAIHASPPCQAYSAATVMHRDTHTYPDLVAPTRELLEASGLPYVIENVVGAPLRNYVQVCGSGLGMTRIRRHRWFESNHPLFGAPCAHGQNRDLLSVTGHGENGSDGKVGPGWLTVDRELAMGIDWMTRDEMSLAVPPAFTEFIGGQLISQLEVAA